MGLERNFTRFMFYARSMGVDFSSTATIGRQGLHLKRKEMSVILRAYDIAVDDSELDAIFTENNGYAEGFLKLMGAKEIESYDYSDYEGATRVIDLNLALDKKFEKAHSVVIDGGSLEHIFNFPVAIHNCMNMLKPGGYYLAMTPANNFCGHGMYQFSPELYFTLFDKACGFELLDLLAFEVSPDDRWYRVSNPATVGNRVSLVNSDPVNLLVIAKRIQEEPIKFPSIQQSDYVTTWKGKDLQPLEYRSRSLLSRFLRLPGKLRSALLPWCIERRIKHLISRSSFATSVYEEVKK